MKRLPKNFITATEHYIMPNTYVVKRCHRCRVDVGKFVWTIGDSLFFYSDKLYAIKRAREIAKSMKVGYIFGIKHGMKYTPKHRSNMVLFDR